MALMQRVLVLVFFLLVVCFCATSAEFLDQRSLRICDSAGSTPHYCVRGRSLWTKEELLQDIETFLNIYRQRPISSNDGGAKINHCFAFWFTIHKLQPPVIIESGVFRGQLTWLLRQAAGKDARIFSLDPSSTNQLAYRDHNPNTTYMMGHHFVDFASVDWAQIIPDPMDREKAVVILDDHMSCISRVISMIRAGFRHLVYDDNWAKEMADNYSFNMVCSSDHIETNDGEIVYMDNYTASKISISHLEHTNNRKFLLHHMEVYYEFPPVFDSCPRSEELLHTELAEWRKSLIPRSRLQEFPNAKEFLTHFAPYVRLKTSLDETLLRQTTPALHRSFYPHLL